MGTITQWPTSAENVYHEKSDIPPLSVWPSSLEPRHFGYTYWEGRSRYKRTIDPSCGWTS